MGQISLICDVNWVILLVEAVRLSLIDMEEDSMAFTGSGKYLVESSWDYSRLLQSRPTKVDGLNV